MGAVVVGVLVGAAIAVADLPRHLWQRKSASFPFYLLSAIPVQYKSREKAMEGMHRRCIWALWTS